MAMSGYALMHDDTAIECATCGYISYNPNDVKYHYCGHCHKFHDDVLKMWTVYDHPADFPDSVVARMFVVIGGKSHGTDECIRAATLEGVRWALCRYHPGLTRLPRSEGDEPQIVETWL
jgi:hypothetical protein